MAAIASEISSLDDINYKSKFKFFLYIILGMFLFSMAFFNFYPVGDKLKQILRTQLAGSACNPEYEDIHMEWLLPKLVVTDLVLPASCFNRQGSPVRLSHVTINYQLINFSPFGIPFRIDTNISNQPLSMYFVQGIGKQMIRIKDQKIVLSRLESLMGGDFKIAGTMMVDMTAIMEKQKLSSLQFKSASKDFQLPPQNIQGLTLPTMKLNEFYIEANSTAGGRLNVDKLIIGDTSSPIRANFRGRIDLQQGAIAFSPIDLQGEVAFSESLRNSLPLIDLMFQSFNQKDGFYQVRLGGMLGQPKPSAP